MSARRFLAEMYRFLVEVRGVDAVDLLMHPPTREERRAARRAELAAVGIEVA